MEYYTRRGSSNRIAFLFGLRGCSGHEFRRAVTPSWYTLSSYYFNLGCFDNPIICQYFELSIMENHIGKQIRAATAAFNVRFRAYVIQAGCKKYSNIWDTIHLI